MDQVVWNGVSGTKAHNDNYASAGIPQQLDPFILDTDASDVAIGAALYQLQNGTLRPISFASHTLAPK